MVGGAGKVPRDGLRLAERLGDCCVQTYIHDHRGHQSYHSAFITPSPNLVIGASHPQPLTKGLRQLTERLETLLKMYL